MTLQSHGKPTPEIERIAPQHPVVLFAGGTDPTGGAGLAADIKSCTAVGAQSCPVVTAVTVQDSGNVRSWLAVPPEWVAAQAESVFDDGPVAAVKTGMLGSPETLSTLTAILRRRLAGAPLVVDPVLRAGGGGSLSDGGLAHALREELLPLATLVTPNLAEASILTERRVSTPTEMEEAAVRILRMGCRSVLLKGGHLPGDPMDLMGSSKGMVWLHGSRLTGEDVHGTGCTLASACASFLACGLDLEDAVRGARIMVRRAISRRFRRSGGMLPGHFPPAGPPPPAPDGNSWYLPPAFCAVCGTALGREPGDSGHLSCTSCGSVHYRNPLPATALLVMDGGKLMLVKRAVEPGRGLLSLPGGFMETGETPLECGARELLEETGLVLREASLFALESDETVYGGIMLAAYEVTSWSGIPLPGDDASAIVWVTPGRAPALAFRAHDRLVARLMERGQP
jgi:hydroxymethylpyrimidine/phosphomethylpyrimidine kinase